MAVPRIASELGQKWYQQGLQDGFEKGFRIGLEMASELANCRVQQAMQEGLARAIGRYRQGVLRAAEAKCGPLTPRTRQMLENADQDQLDAVLMGLVTAADGESAKKFLTEMSTDTQNS
ncbi:MAG: hypothetical protein HUU55_00625 [Myxococcales bacterium]|nr:hypothetical protein [Myxococcales bacterium]